MRERDVRFLIERPMLTEKGAEMKELKNRYVFRVNRKANKREIKEAVEKMFNVKVKDVRTCVYAGKKSVAMNRAGRYSGLRSSWKKAYVTLAEGSTIDAFDLV